MHAIVNRNEPRLLIEAAFGEFFIPEDPRVSDCVCALAFQPAVIPETPQLLKVLTDSRAREIGALPPHAPRRIVVIACRAKSGAEGFQFTGTEVELRGDTSITFVTPQGGLTFQSAEKDAAVDLAAIVGFDYDRAGPPRR